MCLGKQRAPFVRTWFCENLFISLGQPISLARQQLLFLLFGESLAKSLVDSVKFRISLFEIVLGHIAACGGGEKVAPACKSQYDSPNRCIHFVLATAKSPSRFTRRVLGVCLLLVSSDKRFLTYSPSSLICTEPSLLASASFLPSSASRTA